MHNKAFSLIELMVVIAIVALLAAIAVPAYKTYVIKTKISTVFPILEAFKQKQIGAFLRYGVFANAAAFGIGTGATVANPTNYSPYASAMYINAYNVCPGGISPAPGAEISVVFDSTALGYSGSPPLWVEYIVYDYNGAQNTICYYRTDNGMTAAAAAAYLPPNCQVAAPGSC